MFSFQGASSDIQLTSYGPGVLRPGENLNLVCRVTGFGISTKNSFWHWIHQPSQEGLEWIATIYPYDGRTWYAPSLKSRSTVSSDTSKNEFSLQLNSVTVADSAVYFCAREARRGKSVGEMYKKGSSFRGWFGHIYSTVKLRKQRKSHYCDFSFA